MKKARHIFVVPVLGSLIWASAAAAVPPRISFSGCVRPGVEHRCLVVHSGEVLFNVTAARPRPALNRWIAGSGIRAGGATICMQGVQLTAIRWHYVRRLCPAARPPGERN
ncbi:MAG: hypothetical protein QOG13_1192 [Sphingomonadales bacterium]|jgi:hypothetical protein|nr:hypothetical protein [Sphingomonadales bacterium]MEA3045590.1 hypothetical protein [Sphingomonadales bacterium]